MPYLTPDPADYNEVCRIVVIPAGYAAAVMGALDELCNDWAWEAQGDTVADAVAKMNDMIQAAYESDGCMAIAAAQSDLKFWMEGIPINGGALTIGATSSQVFGGYWRQGPPTINDEMRFRVNLDEGTYNLTLMAVPDSASGIITVQIDDVADEQTIDLYSAAQAFNQSFTISVVIPFSGVHMIDFKVGSKNASSANYRASVTYLMFYRTGD